MTLENKIKTIINLGYIFNLEGNRDGFSLSLCRAEWITDSLSQSVSLPTAKGKLLSQVVDWAYRYVIS